MQILRIGCGTLNQTPLDFAGNVERIKEVIQHAIDHEVGLLVLPELCVSGYGCEDQFFSAEVYVKSEQALVEIAKAAKGIAVVVGLPVRHRGSAYNCAALVQDGVIVGVNPKRVLPREGVHYEYRWFRPWSFGHFDEVLICGETVPIGDVRYRLGTVRVAIEICEEAWGAVPASADHAEEVDVVVNPSASYYGRGRYAKRSTLVADASRALQVAYAYSNLVGLEAGRLIYDGGCFLAADGRFVVKGEVFGYREADLCYGDVDLGQVRTGKMRNRQVRAEDRGLSGKEIVGADLRMKTFLEPAVETLYEPVLCRNEFEEFYWAVTTGLLDYLRKCSSKGFVMSLSGGVDSSSCAVLIGHMLEQVKTRLTPKQIEQYLGSREVAKLLTCVYQATDNSGDVTRKAAEELAKSLGATFDAINVQEFVDGYRRNAEKTLGRTLNWQDDDLTLQNIQARVRAPSVWMLANALGALLITTSNRSEGAVGYATMDGDTAGGLAPLAGIDKMFLRRWLVWAQEQTELGLGALPALALVNEQEPTAELRPKKQSQTDEADLMPYEVMASIEKYFVLDKLSNGNIVGHLKQDFKQYTEAQLDEYVARFERLWRISQWKRERLAPSFQLDEFSIDPKSWCRFPILSGT